MPHERLFQAAAITLLVISVGLIIAGAVLDYQDGLGAGAGLYQFGRLLLIGSGGLSIWYFKWSRSKDATARKLPKLSLGAYAFWGVVAALLVQALYVQQQQQDTPFTQDDRVWNLILVVVPPILAALIVTYFLVRDTARSQVNKKGPPRSKAGPNLPKR